MFAFGVDETGISLCGASALRSLYLAVKKQARHNGLIG